MNIDFRADAIFALDQLAQQYRTSPERLVEWTVDALMFGKVPPFKEWEKRNHETET